eukprot:COSAG01_NODE_66030_length_271_cov_0.906977_1_plen_78_part_10
MPPGWTASTAPPRGRLPRPPMDARRPLSVHFRRPRPTAPPPAPRRAPRAERMCDGQLKQCFALLLLLLLSAALPTAAV